MPGTPLSPIALPAANYGALVKEAAPNPLAQLLQAAGQFPEQQNQAKMQKIALQQQQANLVDQQAMAQQREMASAQQMWQFMGQQFLARPDVAANPTPEMTQRLTETANVLGLPPPIKDDGTISTDAWKTPWAQADPKAVADIEATAPGPARDAKLQQFSAVPDYVRTMATALSPKDQAAFARIGALSQHYDNTDAIAAENAQTRASLDAAITNDDVARVSLIKQQGAALLMTAQARVATAQADSVRAAAAMKTADARVMMARTGPGQAIAQSAYRNAQSAVQKLSSQYDGAVAALAAAQGAQVSNDPTQQAIIDHLTAAVAQYKAQLGTASTQLQDLGSFLAAQPGYTAAVKAASGAVGVDVTNTGKKKPATSQQQTETINGTTYYRHADGKWYPTP